MHGVRGVRRVRRVRTTKVRTLRTPTKNDFGRLLSPPCCFLCLSYVARHGKTALNGTLRTPTQNFSKRVLRLFLRIFENFFAFSMLHGTVKLL